MLIKLNQQEIAKEGFPRHVRSRRWEISPLTVHRFAISESVGGWWSGAGWDIASKV